jgi:uncharacterized cupredoxin-like copper-binding protein
MIVPAPAARSMRSAQRRSACEDVPDGTFPVAELHPCWIHPAGSPPAGYSELGESMKTHTALAGLVGLMVLATACSAASPSASTPSASTDAIAATLKEYSIELSPATAAAGSVTFTVTNAGTMVHEFVVLKTDVQAADLPVTNGAVTEDDYTSMGEVADLEPAASGTLTATLAAGHYAIICNLPGHVSQGMVVDLTVQ